MPCSFSELADDEDLDIRWLYPADGMIKPYGEASVMYKPTAQYEYVHLSVVNPTGEAIPLREGVVAGFSWYYSTYTTGMNGSGRRVTVTMPEGLSPGMTMPRAMDILGTPHNLWNNYRANEAPGYLSYVALIYYRNPAAESLPGHQHTGYLNTSDAYLRLEFSAQGSLIRYECCSDWLENPDNLVTVDSYGLSFTMPADFGTHMSDLVGVYEGLPSAQPDLRATWVLDGRVYHFQMTNPTLIQMYTDASPTDYRQLDEYYTIRGLDAPRVLFDTEERDALAFVMHSNYMTTEILVQMYDWKREVYIQCTFTMVTDVYDYMERDRQENFLYNLAQAVMESVRITQED